MLKIWCFFAQKVHDFARFLHENVQKMSVFYEHSPPYKGVVSVWQKPANLYSTKCRIFGIFPPPVAPWWKSTSRRPPGAPGASCPQDPTRYNEMKNKFFKYKYMLGFLLEHCFFYIILIYMKF